MRKRGAAALAATAAAVAAAAAGCVGPAKTKTLPADEWTLAVAPYVRVLEEWCGQSDEAVASYLYGATTKEEYEEAVSSLAASMRALEASRDEPEVAFGTHDEATKRAETAYEALWRDLSSLSEELDGDEALADDPEALTKTYLRYQALVSAELADYAAGYEACGGGAAETEGGG